MMRLYQFRCSHFCEKARWALDFKGLPWQAVDLPPGRHIKAVRRIAAGTSVPVLVDGSRVIQGSAAIITHLDESHPGPVLTPTDAHAGSLALEWERYLETQAGVPLRRWFYFHLLPDRGATLDFLLEGAPWHARPLYTLAWRGLQRKMRRFMDIRDETARQDEDTLRAAFDRLDQALAGRRFLVGERFTRADLSMAALLSRLCRPELDRGAIPAAVQAMRREQQDRRFYRQVRELYAEYRNPLPGHRAPGGTGANSQDPVRQHPAA